MGPLRRRAVNIYAYHGKMKYMLNKILHLIALTDVGLSLALLTLVRYKYGAGLWSMLWYNLKRLFHTPSPDCECIQNDIVVKSDHEEDPLRPLSGSQDPLQPGGSRLQGSLVDHA